MKIRVINGSYSYPVCSDIDGKCIPFDGDFTISVSTNRVERCQFEAVNLPSTGAFEDSQIEGILNPVAWVFSISESAANAGEEVELIFSGTIEENWHLYSSDNTLDPGPIPASFHFNPHESYELLGEVAPIDAKNKFDEIFDRRGNLYFRWKGRVPAKSKN
ncbi:MAG: hypothetical protein U5K79_04170 [Cyclobacteriaceae bacterium]|nr:hypothetical protein [Cyclobacteriaceae bacterium]